MAYEDLKRESLQIAKFLAEYDIGNLRHNAIKKTNVSEDSWTIKYSSADAYYIEFLQNGTRNMEARGTVTRAVEYLTIYLIRKLSGKPTSKWQSNRQSQNTATEENSLRRSLRHISSLSTYAQNNRR